MRHTPGRLHRLNETFLVRKTARPALEVAVDRGLRTGSCRVHISASNQGDAPLAFSVQSKANANKIVETMSIIPGEKAARSTVVMDDGYVATPLAHGGGESAVIVVQPRGVVNTYVDLPTVAADGSTPDSYLEIVSDNSEEAQGRLRIVLTSEMELTTLNRDEILYNCRVELTGTDLNTDTVALIDGESVLVSELEYPSNGFSLLSSDPLKTITEMEYTGDAKVTYVDSTNENDNIAERIITIDNPRSDVVILVTFDTPAP